MWELFWTMLAPRWSFLGYLGWCWGILVAIWRNKNSRWSDIREKDGWREELGASWGYNGFDRTRVGGSPPTNLQTGDSRLRLRLELETPTPTASPDSDCKQNSMNWMIGDSDWSWMDWMIGDSDWSLRRGIEHATVPTARWRIYIYIYI